MILVMCSNLKWHLPRDSIKLNTKGKDKTMK